MSSLRHPVGRQPSSVYWRRRALVGAGIVVVVVVILLIVFAPKGGKPVATPSGSHTPGATTPAASSTDAPACDPADLSVVAAVDQKSYSTESQPQLTFTLTNDGSAACVAQVGSDKQVFRITSGKEVYWSSADCQTDPQPYSTLLQPGGHVSPGSPVGWDRTRSSKSTCDASRPQVPAGGASYHLTVTVDGVVSTNSPQFALQ
jgi:hypothetical protein